MPTVINVFYTDCTGDISHSLIKSFLIDGRVDDDFIKRIEAKAMRHGDGNDCFYEIEAMDLDDMARGIQSEVEAALDNLFGGPDKVEGWEQYLNEDEDEDEDEDD